MDHIVDNIYLGSWKDCQEIRSEDPHSWRIISTADDNKITGHYWFPITDGGSKERDKQYLLEAIELTASLHKENKHNILIHCQSGVNRSPSVVIGALIKNKQMSFIDAFNFVRSKRAHIWPCYQQALNVCELLNIEPPNKDWKGEKNKYTKSEEIVNHLYKKHLLREADPDGLEHYSEYLATGRIDKHKLEKILMNSEEYKRKHPQENSGCIRIG